jgi:hypothetical protein
MGLNFPTAFWKDSNPSDSSDGVGINWDLYLYYSTASNIGAGEVISSNGPLFSAIANGAHPYAVNDANYYPIYPTNTLPSDENAFFGWYLTGYERGGEVNSLVGIGTNDPDYHRANPFILDDNGRELNLFFEADRSTVVDLYREDQYGTTSEPRSYKEIFNGFIQSGYAEGSFTLTSVSDLSIKVSGLGEKHDTDYEKMHLAVDGVHICKGESPGGDDNNPWDMNQVKLFNSAGAQTPPATDYENRVGGTPVDQDNRRFGYTTAGGQATFTTPANPLQNMAAGEHTIKIYFNTNDGQYNSGAFYGFKFTFS